MIVNFTTVFFIVLSIITLIYLIVVFKEDKRMPMILELIYLGIYGLIFLLFMFPEILKFLQNFLGIPSIINFFIYLSIFVIFLFLLLIYKYLEKLRMEITKLNREISFLNKKIEDLEKRNKKVD